MLILSEPQEPDSYKNRIRQVSYKTKIAFARVLFLLLFIALPFTASAGIFSLVAGFLGMNTHNISHIKVIKNSQTVTLLRAANNFDPNPSKGGGDITVVEGSALLSETGPSGSLADIESRPPSDQISIYVVREGDSLSQIADIFGVSINTIIWANDIKRGSLITPGQQLVILPISGVRHTVKSGDTIGSIAKKYKGDLEEILQFNGFEENTTLSVGDIVVIPDGEIATPKVAYSGSRVISGSGGPTYVGYYLRPLVGGVRTQGLHGYNAVDIAAAPGTPVLASAAGTVLISKNWGWNGGYGVYTVIAHNNGTQTLYAHNISNIVSPGQHVVQGQVIGYVGSTGRSTGSHVHFEIRGANNPF